MSSGDGLVKRRIPNRNSSSSNFNHHHNSSATSPQPETDIFDNDDGQNIETKDLKLTLMEEVFLLGLKDKEGYTSFWNDGISIGLRGCILAELALRKRIALEKVTNRRRLDLTSKKVQVINTEHTGDALLDEALRHIRENPPETLHSWIHYLSGETWRPFYLRYQLKNVRERIAKSLVEKGVLATEKKNFFIFDMTTHPLVNCSIKNKLITKVQESVLTHWINDPHKMDKRAFALIILAYHSDVLDNAFGPLSDDDYEMAMSRVRSLLDLDTDKESTKHNADETLWAVFSAIAK